MLRDLLRRPPIIHLGGDELTWMLNVELDGVVGARAAQLVQITETVDQVS